jgi:chemotaxis protein histidine kinase CheA
LKTPPIDDVLQKLRAARRRISAQLFLRALVKAGLLSGAALLIFGAARRWLLGILPFDAQVAGIAAAAAVVIALLVTVARRHSLREVAGVIDRLGATRDRFLTALHFSTESKDEAMRGMAVEECVRFVQGEKFSQLIPVRLPREWVYLLVPLVALALLQWEARETTAIRAAEMTAARASVEDTAKKLEELARQTAKANEQAKSEELKKLADQLQRSAEELRANAANAEEAGKSALRELSALEQMVQEMQKSPATPTPEEMQALAKALEQSEATKDAAAEMAKGNLAKAAEELEKAMQQLAEQKDERTPEEIKQALEQALKKLAEQKQLSEALQKMAQQMQRSAAEQGGNSSEAAKQLAQMLRQMAQGKSGQQQSGQQSAQAMQNLLSALQNMKFGEGQGQPGGEPQPGQAPGVVIQSFAKDGQNPLPGAGDPQMPSGQPGSEHDTGTTDSPLGKDRNAAGQDGQSQQLTGRQGAGESLQQSLTSAGDSSKSNRGYKQLYEAMAPAAQDAVLQENIPLGSRFFIKRYFEAIRPQE